MLLSIRSNFAEAITRRRDEGAALVAVIGVMVLGLIVTSLILASVTSAVGFTSFTRAGMQSQAAAEAGLAKAQSQLMTGNCTGGTYSGADPEYSVVVTYRVTDGGEWLDGCPTVQATEVRLKSSGTAQSSGVTSAGNDVSVVEAIFAVEKEESLNASGPAVYNHSSGVSMNGFTLNPVDGNVPGVTYKNGNFICAGNTFIRGSVTVDTGGATLSGDCRIEGDLIAAGAVTIESTGSVGGTVIAAGVASGLSFKQDNQGSTIGGDVITAGPVHVRGTVTGDIVAGPTGGSSRMTGTTRIGGDLTVAGTLYLETCASCTSAQVVSTLKSASRLGGVGTFGRTGLVVPSRPPVPEWVDFGYDPSKWIASDGLPYAVISVASTDCNWSWEGSPGIAKLRQALASPRPVILDARACQVSMYFPENPKLTSDLVIFAKGFDGGSNVWSSRTSDSKKLWFISPDEVKDGSPPGTCPGSNFVFSSGFRISTSVAALVYTPCVIHNSSTTWRGQMYAKEVVMHGSITLNYVPIGLPGVNLSEGAGEEPPAGASTYRQPTSVRDLSDE
ncbi:hypothetical protein [Marisediminicola sp. LYQ85]|uniref:hypothetical protein n=1 Tax=Marisediminicola sp. LYQ85 TaxID=3391062 RepID=UPI0039830DC2